MPVVPPVVPAVRTVAVGGPSGPQGVPGQSAIQRVASAAMSAGQVVRTHAAGQQMQPATTDLRTRPFDAILLGDIGSGATGNFHVAGPVPANVLQLGAGVACAVGVDVNGRPVRATDLTCVSAPNWIGYCDILGNVTFMPTRAQNLDFLDFGAIPNDPAAGAQNSAAWLAILASLPSAGGAVFLPSGSWDFADTLTFTKPVHLVGTGGASSHSDGSVVYVPAGRDGVLIERQIATSVFADGSQIDNVVLRARGKTTTAHGIVMHGKAFIYNSKISSFAGDGVHIEASNGDGTNANDWECADLQIETCDGNGFYVVGADSNQGHADNCVIINCGGWGVRDASFLGCMWTNIETESNVTGPYRCDESGTSTSCFFNCYSEADQNPSSIQGNHIVLGGQHAAGFTAASTFFGGDGAENMRPFRAIRPITDPTHPNNGDTLIGTLGDIDNIQQAIGFGVRHPAGGTDEWKLALDKLYAPWWTLFYKSVSSPAFFLNSDVNDPFMAFLLGVGIGSPIGELIRVTKGTGAPISGTYQRGSIVINTGAVAGDWAGWICVASGTPGTWKRFGAIEP